MNNVIAKMSRQALESRIDLVGRERELARLLSYVRKHMSRQLVGPRGIGKSALFSQLVSVGQKQFPERTFVYLPLSQSE